MSSPKKTRFTYGLPTDSDIEPEIYILRGTRTRSLTHEYRPLLTFPTSWVPTVQDLTTITHEPEVINLTATSPTRTTTPAIAPIWVDLTISDLSGGEDSDDESSTLLLPLAQTHTGKSPIHQAQLLSITRPIRSSPIRSSIPL